MIIAIITSICVNHFLVGNVFVSYLFGYPLHWQTVSASCINNATVFLLTQLYQSIRHPSKLIFIPTLIQFKQTQRQTKINKITIDMTVKKDGEYINTNNYNNDLVVNHEIGNYKKHSINGNHENYKIEIALPYRLYINQKDRLY